MGSQVYEHSYAREPIAIVGSGCRFPGGASSPSKLWDLLAEPRDIVQEIPPSRFSTKGLYHQDSQYHGSTNVRHAYLLEEDPRVFDRDFFGISPKEAESMDPQQRMLLETVYEGIESAGYSIQQLRGSSTAVFAGVMFLDYQSVSVRGLESLPQYHATGVAMSILANRVSYFYDWKGPSVSIDTACSSSLVALHNAVQTLRSGEAQMAVAAGSNLILGPEPFISESNLNMLSPNGRSYMWDADADGYTRGEGFSAVILKTLTQALADGDHIECIIRETGVNQDGRTPGITMPSATAQAALIRSTYARCGLDPTHERDRPQYFEAHGTGTQAGDPIEAEAIQSVFFPREQKHKHGELIVGSIKTIIGHLEGSAGLAGVIKASLAVQHGQIPANLHFNRLNPKIRPFYSNLRVPTATAPWPALQEGCPRRVSVNSFGFGGTNAHAIIESWRGDDRGHASRGFRGAGPFVLSANSAQTLAARATTLSSYLQAKPETDLSRLSRTLFKRADFPFRAAFSATSTEQLVSKLEENKDILKKNTRITAIPESLPPRILGVFTGQGAQWATMGRELYETSDVFRSTIHLMQRSLDTLPDQEDRPDWTLADELLAPPDSSRVGEASISQPICTALQIALVNVLHAAGVTLAGVVGHSSGEIAAAYAAGYLDAHDAIRVAYYRGFLSRLANGPGGKRGKMMAVGMSLEQASNFCNEFGGVLKVAASNSQRSCTVAGDAEAIDSAEAQLKEAGTFARVLQVDTAYHSHHMLSCAKPYLEAMQKCRVKVHEGLQSCPWYSSVWGSNGRSRSFDDREDRSLLEGQYWVENLTNSVLFSEALQRALSEGHVFDLVLEVGAHPALKGPSSETIQALTGVSIPYSGVLRRGESAVETFADALGLVWKTFPSQGRPLISFESSRRAFPSNDVPKKPAILKDLPAYPFDHGSILWKESRESAIFRTQSQPRHQLLGHAVAYGDGKRREVHWRQVLRLGEIPWLRGHRIQGEYLFPATAYVTMAYEAAVRLVPSGQQAIRLVELHDIDIFRALNLEPDSSGTEILFTIRVTGQSSECITARWACYSASVDADHLEEAPAAANAHVEGSARLLLGDPVEYEALPRRIEPPLPLTPLDTGALYTTLADLGHGYTGDFQAPSMLRRLDHTVVTVPCHDLPLLTRTDMNPAALDTAIHGILAGASCPGDGRQRSVYLPGRVDCIRIAMMSPADSEQFVVTSLEADSFVTQADAKTISGDIDVFDPVSMQTMVQIRGVYMSALPGSQKRDRELYASEVWERDASYGIDPTRQANVSKDRHELGKLVTRMSLFYCLSLREQIKPFEMMLMSKNRKNLMKWVREDLIPKVEAGDHREIQKEWLGDTAQILDQEAEQFDADTIDLTLIRALGKNLASIARGLTPALRVVSEDDMLDQMFSDGLGFREANQDLGTLAGQLSHQYPRMKILEVGGSSSQGIRDTVLASLGKRYTSYTCTDSEVPEASREPALSSKITFKALDIDKDPTRQGYTECSFDLVIASTNKPTPLSQEALSNCRRLLRPGGYLIIVAMTRDYLPVRLLKSLLPGSWLEKDDAQPQVVSVEGWDAMLKTVGFSGVDENSSPSFCSVMLSQAIDDAVQVLRDPLSVPPSTSETLLVHHSNPSVEVKTLASQIQKQMTPLGPVSTISGLDNIRVSPGATVLLLCDLDSPVFDEMHEERFLGLQEVIREADTVLWMTSGATSGKKATATMALGWGRSVRAERSSLKLQFLDLEQGIESIDHSMIVKLLLRLACADKQEYQEVLWTHEPELVLRKDAMYIPRVWPLDDLNHLADARSRDIATPVSIRGQHSVMVDQQGDVVQAQIYQSGISGRKEDQICLEVTSSTTYKIHPEDGDSATYVCIGRDVVSKQRVLALANLNGSVAMVPESDVLYRWDTKENQPMVNECVQLHNVMAALVAESIQEGSQSPVWVHDAPAWLSRQLDTIAFSHKVQLHQTTSNAAIQDESSTRFIHPFITERELELVMPMGAKTFIFFEPTRAHDAFVDLVRKLSPQMRTRRPDLPTSSYDGNVALKGVSRAMLRDLVKEHVTNDAFSDACRDKYSDEYVLTIDEISKRRPIPRTLSVIDWTTAKTVTAKVLPPSHEGLFSPNKTYVLLGLAGDVGISICHWLVEHGARHVVLASRSPRIPNSVIEYTARQGATLRPMAIDLCNPGSLSSAWDEMAATMPPVGGVMNGAMVLRDRLFVDMSWADFSAVLAPKVQGTENLIRLLDQKTEHQLDFLIFFSSAVAVAGNAGQTAYGAANWFMQGVANERRRKGLPASIVHIGHLVGLGYVHRHERKQHIETALHQMMDGLSETDLHDMLAEAIVGGRPGSTNSGRPAELITGIKAGIQASWRQQPRLWHYLVSEDGDDSGADQDGNNLAVKTQLGAAINDQEACLSILEKGFSAGLCSMLHMKPDELDGSMPVASLGIDSLVAVRIREWFLHEVGVEVSVLKVMSASTSLTGLCKDVLAVWRKQVEA